MGQLWSQIPQIDFNIAYPDHLTDTVILFCVSDQNLLDFLLLFEFFLIPLPISFKILILSDKIMFFLVDILGFTEKCICTQGKTNHWIVVKIKFIPYKVSCDIHSNLVSGVREGESSIFTVHSE